MAACVLHLVGRLSREHIPYKFFHDYSKQYAYVQSVSSSVFLRTVEESFLSVLQARAHLHHW